MGTDLRTSQKALLFNLFQPLHYGLGSNLPCRLCHQPAYPPRSLWLWIRLPIQLRLWRIRLWLPGLRWIWLRLRLWLPIHLRRIPVVIEEELTNLFILRI